VTHTSWWWW